MTIPFTVCAPSRPEARSVARGLPHGRIRRIGVGRRRAGLAGADPTLRGASALAVVGIAGGVDPQVRSGDVVVATEVRGAGAPVPCPSAPLLAGQLARSGLRVHTGPVLSTDHVVSDRERADLAADGVRCVDMESAWLLSSARPTAAAVVRVIADDASAPLLRPATVPRLTSAVRRLREVGGPLADWGRALAPRQVLLAGPRSFCAGVVRAVDVVERTLEQHGAPVYVRKQIVHNAHVVRDLESRGAVFVDELDQVPQGLPVIFSAHGVSPAVRSEANSHGLDVIDATCPLVSKVHAEVRRFADAGDTVLFIGHAGHEETEGTMGERPGHTVLVEDREQAATVTVPDPGRVSYLVQTTLAADEVDGIVDVLRRRFPGLRGPASEDICYATTNRQQALQAVATDSDVVLVVGSANSSNSRRLVETAQRLGTPAHLIDEAGDIDLNWLVDAHTIGLTAGASAPTALVDEVVAALGGLGPLDVVSRDVTEENVHFTLPKEVRKR
ncbi:MAG TPA: 4-hydroxy-3-methylbut-2-enyl diphosphate reductase [Segeticoccus sp.]|uniref:4-hydroxy-3-methylbut-2-enyl diphosphate reductase n=1 Tax=Segeticoccus sp. TaxID=2706531 RepID=UPI002D7E2A8B|nr:4-hydroxy-3-methylbut-2-enyl diphosphate reductase [Segeticoccus sp.]HET8600777.1 4-hydroxy-3-methylbut-2-enyl diphosphate reductase [Segeticoccus sp.]